MFQISFFVLIFPLRMYTLARRFPYIPEFVLP